MFRLATAFAATFAISGAAQASTLLVNGDFEAGNTGFSSGYSYVPSGNSGAAQYTVTAAPQSWNSLFANFDDHTPGAGTQMMLINGAGSTTVAWESPLITVAQNTVYDFSFWIASAFATNLGILSVGINGTQLGIVNAPPVDDGWQQATFQWNSGTDTSAGIALTSTSTAFGGNDFALDDISFAAAETASVVPLPAGGWLLLAGLGGLAVLRRRSV